MSLYPEIARFKFKNKWLNIDIPLRIKYITLVKYYCKECDKEGTETEIGKFCENSDKSKIFKNEWDEKKKRFVPTALMENGRLVLCPICKIHGKDSRNEERRTNLYKIYAPPNPERIDMDLIIFTRTAFNYRAGRFGREVNIRRPPQFAAYLDTLDEIYNQLEESRKYAKSRKKTEKCSLTIRKKKVTQKELEHANYVSEQNKFVKQL